MWNKQNNLFELLKKYNFYTCKKDCSHKYGDCNSIMYEKDILVLKINNIPNEMKIKDIDNNSYWINKEAFKPLISLFGDVNKPIDL